MLNIKHNLRLIYNQKILFVLTVFVLLSAPLKVYGPTSIIIEVIIVGLLIYRFYGRKRICLIPYSSFQAVCFYFLYFFATVLFTFKNDGSGFMNENYRFLVFILLTCVLGTTRIDFFALAKFCLWCCRFHIFFTLYELLYLTILSPGDFYGVPFVGAAMPELEESSGYLLENDNLISFGYRPFGLMLQPQKTGFVFVIGAILEYIIADVEKRRPSIMWNLLFVIISILQGAKTAFLILFVIEVAVFLNIYPSKKVSSRSIIFYSIIIFAFIYIYIKNISIGHLGNNTNALVMDSVFGFFRLNLINILIGVGVPTSKDLFLVGGSDESFFIRIFFNLGLPITLVLVYLMSKWFFTTNRKINYILSIAFLGMVYHYCVINVYFIDLAFASAICLALYKEKKLANNL